MTDVDTPEPSQRALIRAAVYVAIVLVVWGVLSLRNPQLTYHFAPLIAGFVGPASLRSHGPIDSARAVPIAAAVSVAVSGFGLVLHLASAMEGPTFWNDGPALGEAVLFAVLGGGLGARVASRPNAGLLGSVFEA